MDFNQFQGNSLPESPIDAYMARANPQFFMPSYGAPVTPGPAALKDVENDSWSWLTTMKDGVKTPGVLGDITGAGSALLNGWLGMKQYGLAKENLAFNKNMFEKNFAAQRLATNSHMEDRQRARVASGSGYESVASYMNKNRIA